MVFNIVMGGLLTFYLLIVMLLEMKEECRNKFDIEFKKFMERQ